MQATVDVFWSFRSPYSYLATPDLLKLREDYNLAVKLLPVLPVALRTKDTLFDPNDKSKLNYILMDVVRRAEYLGMKIEFPQPDPVVMNMETFEVADEQPYIYDLIRLGIAAEREGKGIDVAHAVSHLVWGGTKNWNEGDSLSKAIAATGLDLAELQAAGAKIDCEKEVQHNQQLLEEAGHWGVPTMVFEGEPFFGQDRISTLRWRLDQSNLRRAAD